VPLACTLTQMNVGAVLSATGGAAEVATITVYHGAAGSTLNATATGITCTTGTIANTLGASGSCSDNSHTVSLAAGDTLSLKLHETDDLASGPAVFYSVHLRCQ
jgi:hypothetical protein